MKFINKKKKRDKKANFETVEISEIEHSIDPPFGLEVIPSECWTIHWYDQHGNHRFQEINKDLN